jgi:hypothetical protein
MGAILDYSSACSLPGPTWGKTKKLFHHRGTETQRKAGLAENLSIGKNYTIALKLLTALTI